MCRCSCWFFDCLANFVGWLGDSRMLGVAQDTRSRDGCPLQARAFDGAVVNAGICARLSTRGVELPPGPPDQRSPGTRGAKSRREKARQSGGTRQASPFSSAPSGRCLLTQARLTAAKVPCREIPRTRLPSCERRRPHGSSDDAFGPPPRRPSPPWNAPPRPPAAQFFAGYGRNRAEMKTAELNRRDA
jgi:hypothetical protein